MRLSDFVKSCCNGLDYCLNDGWFGEMSPQIIDRSMQILNGVCIPGMKVLDVGCGTGYALDKFRDMGMDAEGITINPDEVEALAKRGHKVKLMDMHFMDYDDETFDLIWARHSLEHSVIPYFVIHECYRMLKPGGTFYVEIPSPSEKGCHEINQFHFSVMPIRMWLSLINRAKFNVTGTYNITFEADKYHSIIAKKEVLCQTLPAASTQ